MTPLEEMERLRAEFLGMVSHELRTPLTSIKGSAATLTEAASDLDPAEMLQFFRIIGEQADYMRDLIGDLLNVARIETGELSVAPAPAEVATLVDEARSRFQSGGGRNNLRIDLSPELPLVMADGRRIIQVLGNLLSNAARHSHEVHVTASKFSLTTPQATPGIQRAIDPVRAWGYLPIARSLCRASARYVLQTDIVNFYPSIYTHVIPWALHSKSVAKQNRNNFNLLGNVLDLIIRNSQDQQTLGIHIGPDCSLVIAEIILSAVDAALLSTGAVNGFRYLDDYEFGFATYSEGEQALADLQGILSVYELHLNPRKTSLFELPEPIERPWATELRGFRIRPGGSPQQIDLIGYFSRAYECKPSAKMGHLRGVGNPRV